MTATESYYLNKAILGLNKTPITHVYTPKGLIKVEDYKPYQRELKKLNKALGQSSHYLTSKPTQTP